MTIGINPSASPVDAQQEPSEPRNDAVAARPPEEAAIQTLLESAPKTIAESSDKAVVTVQTPAQLPETVVAHRNDEIQVTAGVRALEKAVTDNDPALATRTLEVLGGSDAAQSLPPSGQTIVRQAEILMEAGKAPESETKTETVTGSDGAAAEAKEATLEVRQERIAHFAAVQKAGAGVREMDREEAAADLRQLFAVDIPEAIEREEVDPVEGAPVNLDAADNYVLTVRWMGAERQMHVHDLCAEAIDTINHALEAPTGALKLAGLEEVGTLLHDAHRAEDARRTLADNEAAPLDRFAAMATLRDNDQLYGTNLAEVSQLYEEAAVAGIVRLLEDASEALAAGTLQEGQFGSTALAAGASPEEVKNALLSGKYGLGVIRNLVRAATGAGLTPQAMLAMLEPALFMPGRSCALSSEQTLILLEHLGAAHHDTSAGRLKTLQLVDMVFQGGMPEFADEARALKKALLPGHAWEAELQHSLMLAHARVCSRLLSDAGTAGSRRQALTRASLTSASLRSFVLTPDTVRRLVRASGSDMGDVSLMLANLAVLEIEAARAGVFAADPALVENPQGWVESLGLGKDYEGYVKEVRDALHNGAADDAEAAFERLVTAADDYGKGFAGLTDLKNTDREIRKQAARYDAAHADKIFAKSPDYLARRALNHLAADLGGLIDENERLENAQTGLALKVEAVDAAIRSRTEPLMQSLADSKAYEKLQNDYYRTQGEAARRALRFERHADRLTRLANEEREFVTLKSTAADIRARRSAHDMAFKSLRFSWPHTRRERLENARRVLDFASKLEQLGTLAADSPDRVQLEADLNQLRQTLTGVNPTTLVADKLNRPLTDEVILTELLPRAQALAYFDRRVEGKAGSDAVADTKALLKSTLKLKALSADMKGLRMGLRRKLGLDVSRRIAATTAAAVLSVYSDETNANAPFSLRSEESDARVAERLSRWGISAADPALRPIIRREIDRLTLPDGTLNFARVREYALDNTLRFSGVQAFREYRSRLRSEGSGIHASRQAAKAAVLPQAADVAEGVARLMDRVGTPGASFSLDCSRGLTLDSAAIYAPWDKPGKPFASNVLWPVTARLSVMRNDTLAVTNMGAKYEVLIKGGLAAGIGASIKITDPSKTWAGTFAGDASAASAKGVALTFKTRSEVDRFLEAVMTPDSELVNRSEKKYDTSVWRDALDVRLVSERSVSGNLSATAACTFFNEELAKVKTGSVMQTMAAVGTASAGIRLSGNLFRSRSANERGEVNVFRVQGTATAHVGAAAAAALVQSNETGIVGKESKPVAGLSAAATLGYTREMRLVTNENGIDPTTSLTSGWTLNAAVNGKALYRKIFTDKEVRSMRERDPAFESRLAYILDNLKPGANLTVQRTLRPEVQKSMRASLMAARFKMPEQRRETFKSVFAQLQDPDSYRAAKLTVVHRKTDNVNSVSPGLAFAQFVSRRDLTVTAREGALDIRFDQPPH
ncbi:MAG: hypothetical protein SPJ12_05770 [Duodenibacillus sp.]|nr:hypothetical protein [Duodenibacillus sp.]